MDERPIIQFNKLFRYILTAAGIGIVLFILWYFKWVTIYILMGVVFSLMGRPLFHVLEKVRFGRFKIPNFVNAILSLLSIWIVLGGIIAMLVPLLIREGDRLSKIDPDVILKEIEDPLRNTISTLEKYGVVEITDTSGSTPVHIHERTVVVTMVKDSVDSAGRPVPYKVDTVSSHNTIGSLKDLPKDSTATEVKQTEVQRILTKYVKRIVDFAQIQNFFGSVLGMIANILAAVAASTFIAFFFLKDKNLFSNIVLALVPEKYERQTVIIMHESRKMLSRYFIGLCLELLLVMICTAIGLMIIGFNFQTAVAIGFFCGFFNIIPYIGPLIGGVLGIVLGLAHNIDMDIATQLVPLMLRMGLVFWIVQVLDNNLFQTWIFSSSVNAHPLEIFLVIVLAGTIAGIAGMIFAVPGYTFLRIIARQFFMNFKFVRSLTRNM